MHRIPITVKCKTFTIEIKTPMKTNLSIKETNSIVFKRKMDNTTEYTRKHRKLITHMAERFDLL